MSSRRAWKCLKIEDRRQADGGDEGPSGREKPDKESGIPVGGGFPGPDLR